MHEQHLMADIGKCILAAGLLGLPAYLLRIPLLLAYLAAGVILGPHLGFGLVQSAESIATLSEIGLVLLMFILGLEIDLKKLLQAGRAVLVNGLTQFVGCALLALGFFSLIGAGQGKVPYGIVYLAVATSLSSTLVVVKILSDRMELDSMTSRITLGILVIQDLWAIGFLAVQPDLANLEVIALAKSLGKVAALVTGAWVLARYVLPRVFKVVGKQPELMLIVVMAWCFAMCGLADALKLSLEMGALVAGISIASFPYHFDVASKVSSLRDFFITLFFVSLGLQIPVPTVGIVSLAIMIVAFVILSRLVTIFPVLYALKYGNRASLLPALNLGQLSEFALVLGALGVSYGHISSDLMSSFVIAMVISALLSSFVIPRAHDIHLKLNPLLEKIGFVDRIGDETHGGDAHEKPHVIFLGFHRNASSLLHEMLERHSESMRERLLVVDFNPEAHQKLVEMKVPCKYGDISNVDTLRHLHLHKADFLISTIPDSILKGITNLQLLRNLRTLAPEAQIVVCAETFASARQMYDEGASYVFLPRVIGAEHLADVIDGLQSVGPQALRQQGLQMLANRDEVLV